MASLDLTTEERGLLASVLNKLLAEKPDYCAICLNGDQQSRYCSVFKQVPPDSYTGESCPEFLDDIPF